MFVRSWLLARKGFLKGVFLKMARGWQGGSTGHIARVPWVCAEAVENVPCPLGWFMHETEVQGAHGGPDAVTGAG